MISLFLLGLGSGVAVASDRGAQIRAFAQSWLGTPYVWGGNGRAGIDCSGFLREMYQTLFGVGLPRTTRQQIDLGRDLSLNPRSLADGLEPGDVIFYIDPTGTPNHVVTYAGLKLITHSVSGRGVVIESIEKIYGRRVVARRFLVPRGGGGGGYEPIPPAGPIVIREIPCPPSFRAKALEARRYKQQPITDLKVFGEREICDFRALATAVKGAGPIGAANAIKLEDHARWLESIDSLKDVIDGAR